MVRLIAMSFVLVQLAAWAQTSVALPTKCVLFPQSPQFVDSTPEFGKSLNPERSRIMTALSEITFISQLVTTKSCVETLQT